MQKPTVVIEHIPMPEPDQAMTPLLDNECYDIDERGLGEDVAWHPQSLVQSSTELPKEVAVGIAAGTIGGGTCIIILIIIGVVLGLGLGLGAGVGLGVGFGLHVCPNPSITGMTPKLPMCFDSNIEFYDLSVQGSNFIQALDANGKLIANPSISLYGATALPMNMTAFKVVTCSDIGTTGTSCAIMNTTGLHKSFFNFVSGYAAPAFKITNDQCTVAGSTTVLMHAAQPSYVSNTPFCISNSPSDPNFTPLVTLSVQGFISTATDITIGSIGTFPIISVDNCVASSGVDWKICKTVVIQPNGNSFQSYTQYPITFKYNGGPQPCAANIGTIYGSTYATVSGISQNQFDCTGTITSATLTGTNFMNPIDSVQPTFYLQDASNANGPLVAATGVSINSATSAVATWSGLTSGKSYKVVTKNGLCVQTQSAITVSSLSVAVTAFSPDCTGTHTCDGGGSGFSLTITATGSLANIASIVFTSTTNKPTKTYTTFTAVSFNSVTWKYGGNNALLGTWTVVLTNANGCASSPSAQVVFY